MFALGDELGARQLQLRLVIAPGSSIARMLAITGLDKTYPTYPTLADGPERVVGGRAADDGLERLDEVRLVEVAEVERHARPVALAVGHPLGGLVQADALEHPLRA